MDFFKKISPAIIFILIQIITNDVYSQTLLHEYTPAEYTRFVQSDYLNINESHILEDTVEGPEHPLRRFEITFFISVPFVFVLTFTTLHVYDVARKKDPNVNVWEDYKPGLLAGTIGISSGIALREAIICMKMNRQDKQEKENLKAQSLLLYVSKSY